MCHFSALQSTNHQFSFSKKSFECSLQKETALLEDCSIVFYAASAPISHNNHPQKHKLKFCKSSAYLFLALITVTTSKTLGKVNVIVQKIVFMYMINELKQAILIVSAVLVYVYTSDKAVALARTTVHTSKPIYYRLGSGKPFSLVLKGFGYTCANWLAKSCWKPV